MENIELILSEIQKEMRIGESELRVKFYRRIYLLKRIWWSQSKGLGAAVNRLY
jgi:hypothetical protein